MRPMLPNKIKFQYKLENDLRHKLLNSNKEVRKKGLYTNIYNEFYQKFPEIGIKDSKSITKRNKRKLRFINRFLNKKTIFLEIGAGDCNFALMVAKFIKKVYLAEVSNIITKNVYLPKNTQLIIYDGININMPSNSVSLIYSSQVMEHLHPDDALDQLKDIYNILKYGGRYVCITPNKISGPHDISKHYGDVATGLHLKEYSYEELNRVFEKIGFSKVISYIGGYDFYLKCPISLLILIEKLFQKIPKKIRRTLLMQAILGINVIAIK